MSINHTMSIALNSMKNNQNALAVVSHNIANLNTKGYAKERVNFSESRFTVNSKSPIARINALNGAEISSVTNYIDSAKFKGVVDSNTDANYYNELANALKDLDGVADDLGDNGLNALLNDFFTCAASLEQFPSDLSIRQQYVAALDNICDKFNCITDRYDSIQDEQYLDVSQSVTELNSLFNDLATLNVTHVRTGLGSSTQNEINNILQEVSKYGNITYDQNANGTYNLMFGGMYVVRGTDVMYEVESNFDPSKDQPLTISLKSTKEEGSAAINDQILTGSLKGKIDFLNGTNSTVGFSTVSDMKKAIQSAQTAFADALNGIQTYADAGSNTYAAYLTSNSGELVLASDGGDPNLPITPPELLQIDSNGKIKVNQDVIDNPFYVAAARIDLSKYQPGEDWTKSIGNADNANLMTALQNEKICSIGDGTNNCTLSQFLINNAAKNGIDLASMENKAELYQGIADKDANDYNDLVGVNLDEELADMVRYQRAYEASAKIFTVVNDIMQMIIGMA